MRGQQRRTFWTGHALVNLISHLLNTIPPPLSFIFPSTRVRCLCQVTTVLILFLLTLSIRSFDRELGVAFTMYATISVTHVPTTLNFMNFPPSRWDLTVTCTIEYACVMYSNFSPNSPDHIKYFDEIFSLQSGAHFHSSHFLKNISFINFSIHLELWMSCSFTYQSGEHLCFPQWRAGASPCSYYSIFTAMEIRYTVVIFLAYSVKLFSPLDFSQCNHIYVFCLFASVPPLDSPKRRCFWHYSLLSWFPMEWLFFCVGGHLSVLSE